MTKPPRSDYEIGYGRPPDKYKFVKGQCGNRLGRPKRPEGVSLTELLDVTQRTKNGDNATLRDGVVAELCRDAMNGKPKAFLKFVKLLQQAGLLRKAANQLAVKNFIIPIDRSSPESPVTYEAWLRKEGRYEEADKIKSKYGL
ncbi:hypothetical protein JJE66_26565 [Bradyrhizobium diazoefficiens]|uniref:DUF5681 domain-containing protein n=1 Tax=Bradyrhizobium diazoefficiens TaxID=1355477 RepID=UPI00190B77FA|nr:DUF5681 domain-containing protein [Bradyrhizobium diazoefficiens]MBK3664777.1 hypothetical protein [Bradyrhizobium diazoefficiens]